jgi:uncharacterized 2Fe-2S/4Fe-4S cluster protein (DUF4445 family)
MAVVKINGISRRVKEWTFLSELTDPHFHLETPCGGIGRCGKCRVVAHGALSPPSAEEKELLTADALASGVRLACCTRVLGDCQITVNAVSQAHVLGSQGEFLPQAPMFSRWGAAVDIGTTTVAACLFSRDGTMLAQAGCMNPQACWGADVITRIGAALNGKSQTLAESVRDSINNLLNDMAAQAGIFPEDLDGIVITGNTAMLYLLTETDPDCLSHAPFEADRLFGETLSGAELGLCCGEAAVYLPRCVSAFVGADTSTALLASGIIQRGGTRMLADIGTNGEIALWDNGSLLCCSTAAGPAFEGAGITMGMPGRDGAVDHVEVRDNALQAHVLGEGEATGICGSGVVDALACLLETQQMDETGFLDPDPAAICGKVILTQKDVRAVQLAKSAVAAGIITLLKTAGRDMVQVEELAIAGGFGSYLNTASAGRIGLIPDKLVPCVNVLGNAALQGAAMLLLDQTLIGPWEEQILHARTIDLTSNPLFLQEYTDGMFF